jgi:hypothetical protein
MSCGQYQLQNFEIQFFISLLSVYLKYCPGQDPLSVMAHEAKCGPAQVRVLIGCIFM